jgi:uncharacterized membrane protein
MSTAAIAGSRGEGEMSMLTDRASLQGGQRAGTERHREEHARDVKVRAGRRAWGLGWFSLGLGVSMLAAPRAVARIAGVRDDRRSRSAVRAIGVREIAAGLGILTQRWPAHWVWARVGGDVMDLAFLGSALMSPRTSKSRVLAAAAALAGVTYLDTRTGRELLGGGQQRSGRHARHDARAVEATTVQATPEEAYRFWRDTRNLPRFMSMVTMVQILDERRSRWIAEGPGGRAVEWDVEIVADRPGEVIAWRAARSGYSGAVSFTPAPGGRGTEVRFEMEHVPWRGVLSGLVARALARIARPKMANDLRRFKQLVETGEVVASDASIYRGPHPAQPPGDDDRSRRRLAEHGGARAEGGAR